MKTIEEEILKDSGDENAITLTWREALVAGQALNFAVAELRSLPERDTRTLRALVLKFERLVNDEPSAAVLP